MKSNIHSTGIPADIVEQAIAKVQEAYDLLKPHTTSLTLTTQDRVRLLKMGPKTLDFVGTAFESAKKHPEILPAHVDMDDFGIDYGDVRRLYPLQDLLETMLQGVSDFTMVAGSEALQAGLVILASAKLAAAQKVQGAQVAYENMKEKYPRGRRRATAETTETTEA